MLPILARTRARGDVGIGLVQIYKALGGGWQIRINNPRSRSAAQGMINNDKYIQTGRQGWQDRRVAAIPMSSKFRYPVV